MLAYFRKRLLVRAHVDQIVRALGSKLSRGGGTGTPAKLVQEIASEAVAFARVQDLGFMSRAQFANEFKWRLRELDCSDEFVDSATMVVAQALGRSRPSPIVARR